MGRRKAYFDKAQLMLFFLYLMRCVRGFLYSAKEESVHHELVQKVSS